MDGFKKMLKDYLRSPYDMDVDYNYNVNIFKSPVNQILFWKSDVTNVFFSVYKYKDKYIVINDFTGDLYSQFIHSDEESFHDIVNFMFNNIKIYKDLNYLESELAKIITDSEFNDFAKRIIGLHITV